jgi:S-formylglutathione hydrolase FrmB
MAWLQVNFKSAYLLHNVTLNLVLPIEPPPGVPAGQPVTAFKTLYLLNGLTGDSSDWLLNAQVSELSQRFGIAIVMPAGENSFYTDHASSDGQYSQFIGRELVDFTRRLLPLSKKREDTILGGLSMGGYGALYNGLRHHETFGHTIALSSALIYNMAAESSERPDGMGLNRAYYERIFGDLAKLADSDKNLNNLAAKIKAEAKTPLDIYFACGWNDMLLFDNRDFHKYLEGIGFAHTYEEGPGTHEWAFWNTFLRRGLERILTPIEEYDEFLKAFWIDKPED